MLAVTLCATPTPAYNHQFFFSHPRTPFSFKLCFLPYFGRMQVDHAVITLRTRTNPPPLSCARALHSPFAVVLKHFIYPLRKAPYIPFYRVTVRVPYTSLLSSYLPLLPVLSGEGEHGGRGRRVLLMYSLEIALAKSINSSYLGCERVNFGECLRGQLNGRTGKSRKYHSSRSFRHGSVLKKRGGRSKLVL